MTPPSLNPVLPAVWLPMSIGFFFPLGWLPENLALQVWYIFNILEICLIVYFAQGPNCNLYDTLALALICFFFPLTFNHINLGQFSITITLCWVLAALFSREGWALGIGALHRACSVQTASGISCRTWLELSWLSKWRTLCPMVLSWMRILIMCLVLCVPLFVAYPNWIPDAIVSMRSNPPWSYPSLYILFERYYGAWGHVPLGRYDFDCSRCVTFGCGKPSGWKTRSIGALRSRHLPLPMSAAGTLSFCFRFYF